MAGWAGGVKQARRHNVPREPAKEALYAFWTAQRTDAHFATPVFWGNLLGYRTLGVTTATFGVQFYLTARGTACGRGYSTKEHEGAKFTNVKYKCKWK